MSGRSLHNPFSVNCRSLLILQRQSLHESIHAVPPKGAFIPNQLVRIDDYVLNVGKYATLR